MKKIVKNSGFFFFGFALLTLFSCALPGNKEQNFDPAAIKTITLFPITYDQAYAPPQSQDLKGMDLSAMIRRQIEKTLTEKGYVVQSTAYPAAVKTDQRFGPLKIDPLILAGSSFSETDGLMQVHVTFHFGIDPTERSSDEGPFSEIYLNATARLIAKEGPVEIWRGSGRARPFKSANFAHRLNYAVYTLAGGILKTFPTR